MPLVIRGISRFHPLPTVARSPGEHVPVNRLVVHLRRRCDDWNRFLAIRPCSTGARREVDVDDCDGRSTDPRMASGSTVVFNDGE